MRARSARVQRGEWLDEACPRLLGLVAEGRATPVRWKDVTVSAARAHVPPDTVLGLAVGLMLVPYASGGQVHVALVSTAAAAALVDFWMACVPPY